MDADLVGARRVLLDALDALGIHREAVILVGAQAIYLRVGDSHLAVEPYTRDADIALEPTRLADEPPIGEALRSRGFKPDPDHIGRWWGEASIPIDLLVPEELSGPGRRAARLPDPHGKETARKARGLEAALVANTVLEIPALDALDDRTFPIRVADPAALLVAKLHKIHERKDETDRVRDKDALDALRILRGTDTTNLAQAIHVLLNDPLSSGIGAEAVAFVEELFGSRTAMGSQMAASATVGRENSEEIVASCAALTNDLLTAIRRTTG